MDQFVINDSIRRAAVGAGPLVDQKQRNSNFDNDKTVMPKRVVLFDTFKN